GSEVEIEILERKPDRGRFVANPVLAHLEANWSRPKPFESRAAVSAEGLGVGRSTESLHSFFRMHWDAEPVRIPLNRPPGTFSPSGGGGWDEGGRCRERPNDCPGLADTLRVAVCPNPDAEVVLAAREILRYVRAGGRYRDCAVLVRTHAGYHDALRRVFQRYEIPFFLDRREPVAHHPLAELTRYTLRTVALGWEHDDWFGALKTGLVPGDEAEFDALENQALARGWKADAWKRPLKIAE